MNPLPGRKAPELLGFLLLAVLAGCAPSLVQKKTVSPEEQRAFDAGTKAFYDREFDRAIAGFRTLGSRFPDSALNEETSWMLARSIEERADFGEALRHYKIFIKKFPLSRHRSEAGFRVQHLENFTSQGPAPVDFPRRVGFVSGDPGGMSGRLSRILPRRKLEGERVLVIPAAGEEGVYFETRGVPLLDPVLPALILEAQELGWKVWAAVEIRRIPGFTVSGDEKGGPSAGMDLFDPSAHGKLAVFFKDLAQTGLDGIVIDDDPLYDPLEGFSAHALRAFQKEFGRSADLPGRADSGIQLIKDGKVSDDPLLWKLTGWRNRETMRRIKKLIREVQEEVPFLVWAQRVSRGAVTEPHSTLLRTGENLAQSLQSGFDFIIVPFSFRERDPDPYAFLRKAGEMMAEPRRMILALPMDEREWVDTFEEDLPRMGFIFRLETAGPLRP